MECGDSVREEILTSASAEQIGRSARDVESRNPILEPCLCQVGMRRDFGRSRTGIMILIAASR